MSAWAVFLLRLSQFLSDRSLHKPPFCFGKPRVGGVGLQVGWSLPACAPAQLAEQACRPAGGGGQWQPGVRCSQAALMAGHPPPPGAGLLPLLRTAPGLRRAAAPALVGDCGKRPLSQQHLGPGRAGAREGGWRRTHPPASAFSLSLLPSPGRSLRSCPVLSLLSRSSSLRSVAQGLTGLVGI